jgi:hypothetical protein
VTKSPTGIVVSQYLMEVKLTTRLIPRENNLYDVQVGEITYLTVDAASLNGLPIETISSLLKDGLEDGLAIILLAAVRNGKEIVIYPNS